MFRLPHFKMSRLVIVWPIDWGTKGIARVASRNHCHLVKCPLYNLIDTCWVWPVWQSETGGGEVYDGSMVSISWLQLSLRSACYCLMSSGGSPVLGQTTRSSPSPLIRDTYLQIGDQQFCWSGPFTSYSHSLRKFNLHSFYFLSSSKSWYQ